MEGKTITYNGAFVYEDGALQYILNEEGRYNVNGANAGYECNLKDHLGNVRMVINSAGEVKQASNYYPFGGIFDQFTSADNKYQFGGKELQEETDWLDFGARMYQPELGRWLCFDPMAEKAHNRTPYRYCFNNPMNVTDPTGLYEWNFNEYSNLIYYAGERGGALTQHVNNLFTGLEMTMDNSTFDSYFGLNPANWTADQLKGQSWDAGYYGGDIQQYKEIVNYNSRNFTPLVSMDWGDAEDNYNNRFFSHKNENQTNIFKQWWNGKSYTDKTFIPISEINHWFGKTSVSFYRSVTIGFGRVNLTKVNNNKLSISYKFGGISFTPENMGFSYSDDKYGFGLSKNGISLRLGQPQMGLEFNYKPNSTAAALGVGVIILFTGQIELSPALTSLLQY